MMKFSIVLALAAQLAVAAPDVKTAGTANNQFGLKLFNNTKKRTDKGNKFLSPVSAYLALSMLYNGAKGITEKEMTEVLGLSGISRDEANEMNHEFMHALTGSKDYTLKIANSAWVKDDFTLLPEFQEALSGFFHARATSLDFADPKTVDKINDWVKKATLDQKTKKPLISEILKKIPPEAVLYLINATYFDAEWSNQFKASDTRNQDFHVTAKKKVQVPMMTQTGRYKAVVSRGARTIELPYKGQGASLVLIVPEGGNTVDKFAASLDEKAWAALTSNLDKAEYETYDVTIPKLKLEYEDSLNEALIQQGMGSAFDKGAPADLKGISDAPGHLYVSNVKQKTFLEVDEKGTKAAAVTAVEVGLESIALPGTQFVVDKPYLLAIREKSSNAIVFLGSIQEPEGGKLPARE